MFVFLHLLRLSPGDTGEYTEDVWQLAGNYAFPSVRQYGNIFLDRNALATLEGVLQWHKDKMETELKCCFDRPVYIYRTSRKFINNTPETAKVPKDLIQQASSTRPGIDCILHSGHKNPMQHNRFDREWLQSCPVEKDLGLVVDRGWTRGRNLPR